MRHGRNFNPEWGYVAPARGFMRTACLIVVAAIISAFPLKGITPLVYEDIPTLAR
jgi:hypothetical protein